MEINLKQLNTTLKKTLHTIYLLTGDETLLLQEARDCIRQAAKQQAFDDVQLIYAERNFNWSTLNQYTDNLSLFSRKRIIDLRHPKLDDKAKKFLETYLQHPDENTILLISMDKLTASQKKTKCYQLINKAGAIIPIWPIKIHELPSWISLRLQKAGLNADQHSIRLLIEYTQGNLLAAKQAIEKLTLLYPQQKISPQQVMQVVSDNARFNVFDLTNAALQGQAKQTLRTLHYLRTSGTEPTLVLWSLTREIQILITKQFERQHGASLQQVLSNEWQTRKTILQSALNRLSLKSLQSSLKIAKKADHAIKGVSTNNAWDLLADISLLIATNTTSKIGFTSA